MTATPYTPATDPRVTAVIALYAAAINAALTPEVDPVAQWRRVSRAQAAAQSAVYVLARELVAGVEVGG